MARGIAVILLGVIVSLSIIYLIDNQSYAQSYNGKKSYAEIHGLEPIIDKDGKKQFLIMYKDRVKDKDIDELRAEGYAKIKKKFDVMPAVIVSMDEKWMAKIHAKKNVVGIYEDFKVQAVLDNSVPKISADQVHNTGLLGTGVKVCIIDTGVDDSHPAIELVAEQNFVVTTQNFDPDDANDDQGHGTHVAGIVGSTDATYKGVAPGVSLMASKVLNQFGGGSFAGVLAGINWCVANGANVLNLSLGSVGVGFSSDCDDDGNTGMGQPTLIEQVSTAISNAYDDGIVTVAAAGNDNFQISVLAPACASRAIAVAGTDDNDNRYVFSNRSPLLDVAAPGVSIKSTLAAVQQPGGIQAGEFGSKTGTSMSTPHVAGAAALLMSYNSTLSPGDIQNLLEQNAVDLPRQTPPASSGPDGFDTDFGWGRIDVWAALLAADITAPSQPVNQSPTNALVDNEDLPFFDWSDSTDDVSVDHYTLEIATDSGFTTIIQTHVINPVSFKQLVTPDELAEGEYFWRVTTTDAANNDSTPSATYSFSVDLSPPTLQNIPADPTLVEGNAPNSYDGSITPAYTAPTATDTVDANPTVVCDVLPTATYTYTPPNPTNTPVTCTATDESGNESQATFNVQVQDNVAPALQAVPADPTLVEGNAPNSYDGSITPAYTAPTATDAVDANPTVGCDVLPTATYTYTPPNPTNTPVTCTATDDTTNTSQATFNVQVQDNVAPVVTPPADVTEEATSASGATVIYPDATATDDVGVTSGPTCIPASGSTFPIGDTIVTCTAGDATGNVGSATFTITVNELDTDGLRSLLSSYLR